MASLPSIITLTTDFGYQDEYVGVMKGVILARSRQATLVDLCHEILPQQIEQAAFLLAASYRYFPADTLHVTVVDPGVGTDRRILCLKANEQYFLAPDNGVLSRVLEYHKDISAYAVTNEAFFFQPVSATFHGRDIFAPVAAAVVNGTPLASLGPQIDPASIVRLNRAEPRWDREEKSLCGKIIHIDRFGNLCTNILPEQIAPFPADADGNLPELTLNGAHPISLADAFADIGEGCLALIKNSRGCLEIAAKNSSAAAVVNQAAVGAPICLTIGQNRGQN